MKPAPIMWAAMLVAAAACGSDGTDPLDVVDNDTTDASSGETTGAGDVDVAETVSGDAGDVVQVTIPLISSLDESFCGADVPPGASVRSGSDLHRVSMTDPGAVCNDGTPGAIYVRAATDVANANNWVIFLQGGSFCGSYMACIERWCGVSYSAAKMSSLNLPPTIGGNGILSPKAANPFSTWNAVLGYYCSSDLWTGDHGDVVASSDDGNGDDYRIHFRGSRIIENAIELLKTGVTSDNGVETMPVIADDALLLFTGSSAGGFGVSHKIDAISAANPSWRVSGVVDGNAQPLRDAFPAVVDNGVDAFNRDAYEPQFVTLWGANLDTSCLDGQSQAYRCTDQSIHLLNHVTTALFVRQDLSDALLRRPYLSFGGTLEQYAAGIVSMLDALGDAPTNGAEAGLMARTPGRYGTQCGQHTTLSSDAWFGIATSGNASVSDPTGTPRTLAAALTAWLMGNDVALVDEPMGTKTTCADPEDTGD